MNSNKDIYWNMQLKKMYELKNAFNETTDNAVKLLKENVELKNRIDRAIEYIEKHYTIKKEGTIYMTEDTGKLLNILKGEDK